MLENEIQKNNSWNLKQSNVDLRIWPKPDLKVKSFYAQSDNNIIDNILQRYIDCKDVKIVQLENDGEILLS